MASRRKKIILFELILLLAINITFVFFAIKLNLFERFYELTREYGEFYLGELLLLGFTLLLSIVYLLFRQWRSSVVNARLAQDQSTKDSLTKLLNRRTLERSLLNEWDRYSRYNQDFCIVQFDIDDFSDINERLGHIEGDRVLMDVAKILIQNTRKTDVVGRWGEEEFLILCPACNSEQASLLAEKLRAAIYGTLKDGIELSASFAVVQSNPVQTLEDLMKRVDFALHKAKGGGKNCVIVG